MATWQAFQARPGDSGALPHGQLRRSALAFRLAQAAQGAATAVRLAFRAAVFTPQPPPAPTPPPLPIIIPVPQPPPLHALGAAGNVDYGVDIYCLDDLDPGFALITGRQVLAQDIYHGWTTQKGTLVYDADWGEDVSLLLSEVMSPQTIASWQGRLAAQAERDDRVQTAAAAISFNEATQTATIVGQITPLVGGPFKMVMQVSQLSTALLQVS